MTKHRNPPLSISIAVRFTDEEAKEIRAAAQTLGIPYSELVRQAVAAFLKQLTTTVGTGSSITITVDGDATWSRLA